MAEFEGRLSKAPVVYVLCQVRFSPVLKMGDYVPAIQEGLREFYPRFTNEFLTTLQIPAPGNPITPATVSRWNFIDRESRSGFSLESGSLVFHTTAYTDFPEFLARALVGIRVVHASANIPLVERVGLRYIDLLVPEGNESVDVYVQPQLLGLSLRDLGIHSEVVQQFVMAKTDTGQLYLKFSKGKHPESVPSDLLPLSLSLTRRPPANIISALLDTDHFSEAAFDFDVSRIESVLTQLQVPIGAVFRSAISQHAVNTWK